MKYKIKLSTTSNAEINDINHYTKHQFPLNIIDNRPSRELICPACNFNWREIEPQTLLWKIHSNNLNDILTCNEVIIKKALE
jgi:hypothetical protein